MCTGALSYANDLLGLIKSSGKQDQYNPFDLIEKISYANYLLGLIKSNIYTSSVFCYDKHKKNFDIQFSMKRHETV